MATIRLSAPEARSDDDRRGLFEADDASRNLRRAYGKRCVTSVTKLESFLAINSFFKD
jgi:hypothetical protein